MERYVIKGGLRLHGDIEVCGSKNAVLPILAATILSKETCVILNTPKLYDVLLMIQVLESLGAKVKWEGDNLIINAAVIDPSKMALKVMQQMRASGLLLGPLLSRFNYVRIPFPGGCDIGARPMDYHLKGLRQLGATIKERYGYIEAHASSLKGGEVYFDFPSVGATENIMMAGVLAKGDTIIRNAAREPEIVDLANFLKSMGAKIWGAGSDTIRITGANRVYGVVHQVIPDRIVAGTYMLAAAITKGDIVIKNAVVEHLEPLIAKLTAAGVNIKKNGQGIRVMGNSQYMGIEIKTMPYPGFPTDIQPQIMAFMSMIQGTSLVLENIFENRFKHAGELKRMGASIRIEGRLAVIEGTDRLMGTEVIATDLRAGAALVLAGLGAEGVTLINNIEHIDRGYHRLEDKYTLLGANIKREQI